jgi:hypothetical protein
VQWDQGDEGKAAVWLLRKDSTRRRKRVKRVLEATRRKVDGGGCVPIRRGRAALLEAAVHAHGEGGLANRGGR